MPVKMIVTDLDRTLLRTDKSISGYTADVLNRCREKGIKVVFATARPLRLTKDFRAVILPDAVIANNGATIAAGCEIICEHIIPDDVKRDILYDLSHNKAITRMSAESGDSLLCNDDPPKMLADTNGNWNAVYTDFRNEVTANLCKISVHCLDPEIPFAITAKYPGLHVYPVTGEDLYSILPGSATKSNGVKAVAGYFKTGIGETAAFGDDCNDIEMLRDCGIGVAMSNALDEVKAAADFICESNDDDGVAKWLAENVL